MTRLSSWYDCMFACYTAYLGHDLRGGGAQQICDKLQLVHHIPPGEQGLAKQNLSKDAAYAPDVSLKAPTQAKDDFRRPVVPGRHNGAVILL